MASEYLTHYGVLGMKWGVRRSKRYSKALNKKLTTSFRNLDEYEKSKKIKTINNTATNQPSTFLMIDTAKQQKYNESVKAVNAFMDKLDKKGASWRYDSNHGINGRLTKSGKGYVETIVNGQKTREEFD